MTISGKNSRELTLALFLAAALALPTGCTGDDGERGPLGPEGPPGPSGALDPNLPTIDKAYIGAGGKDIIDSLTHFSTRSAGSRFTVDEGFSAGDPAVETSTFELEVSYDVAGNRLRLDYQREYFFIPGLPEVEVAYSEIIDGDRGVVNGDDDFFPGDPDPDIGDMSSLRWGAVRRQQRLLNPHAILKEISSGATTATEVGIALANGTIHELLEVPDAVAPLTLWVNHLTGEVSRLTTVENDYLHRDVALAIHFGDYQKHAGLLVPHAIIIERAGEVLATEKRGEFLFNPSFAETLFDFPAGSNPPAIVAADAALGELSQQFHHMFAGIGIPQDFFQLAVSETELGDAGSGVYHLTGGSHHSMLIKQANGIVIVEAPLYPEHSEAVIARAAELFPGVPITHVIATHHHVDHSAGLRAFVNAGATVVVQERSEFFFRDIFRAPSTVVEDELAKAPSAPPFAIMTVPDGGQVVLPDASNPVAAHHFPTSHSDDMLLIHVRNPGSNLDAVFNADLWNPDGASMGFSILPAAAAELRDAIESEIIAPTPTLMVGAHGATGTFADLDAKAGN